VSNPQPQPEEVIPIALKVWNLMLGARMAMLVNLGDELGLYRAMQGAGPLTPSELAARTGLAERLVREWLLANAAAELLVTENGQRFELTDAAAAVLADEAGSEWFAAGAFSRPFTPEIIDGIADSFRTGVGLPYDAFGAMGAHATARSLGPWVRRALVPRLLPLLDGVVAKLKAGATVADVGCGAGVALEALAAAFPASQFWGFDPSRHAIEAATARMRDAGLTNVVLHELAADDVPAGAGYDLVLTFDCLHDMPRPADAAHAIRRSIAEDGTWLVKEIRSTGSFPDDRRNPMLALMYGMSVTTCLQSSLSEPGAAGYGTLGLPPGRLEAMAHDAGFRRVTQHDIGEPPNLYYEIRV
jgi:2-polyprenyl-3-methyl-5-hydroxy-6-metoxy-1,4-benzoquinol methylase